MRLERKVVISSAPLPDTRAELAPVVDHRKTALIRAPAEAPSPPKPLAGPDSRSRHTDVFEAPPVSGSTAPRGRRHVGLQLDNSARYGLLSRDEYRVLQRRLSDEGPTVELASSFSAAVDSALASPTRRVANLTGLIAHGALAPGQLLSAHRELRSLERTLARNETR